MRLAPALFGALAFLVIATSPCTARASDDGEPDLEGPPLRGVVGRAASVTGYEYSDALRAKGGHWPRERLDRWIAGPAAVTPGTKMTLGGVRLRL